MRFLSRLLFFVWALPLLFNGCTTSDVLPGSTGKPGELIVVMDSSLWKGEAGQVIRDSLMAAFPALPQYEPLFRVVHVSPSEFKNILRVHRNILIVETGPLQDQRNFALSFKNNVWAQPQLVLNFRAINSDFLASSLLLMSGRIIEKFSNEEKKRMSEAYLCLPETKASRDIDEAFGIKVPFTGDYYTAIRKGGYSWVRRETANSSFGFQFLRMAYTSDTVFAPSSIIAIRDSVSRLFIPGPSQGSYMTTDRQFPVVAMPVTIDSCYAIEVEGLWRTEGDFMGGPFRSYLIHNKKKDELLFIDAFIYAPKFNKREYVKQMEATVEAIRFD